MGDACCAHDEAGHDDGREGEAPSRFWRIREVQLSIVAGAFLVAGLVAGAADAGGLADAAFVVALVTGGSTFVP